jgi:hypothetical protein
VIFHAVFEVSGDSSAVSEVHNADRNVDTNYSGDEGSRRREF